LQDVAQTSTPTSSSVELLGQQIAYRRASLDNHPMENGRVAIAHALALNIDDVQGHAAEHLEPPRRIRRQGTLFERHQSLARNLQRDVWKVTKADEKARVIEDVYGLQEN
jgi:hypothetical protein